MNDSEMITCPDPAQQLTRLRAIMHRLRAPGGCPWDAEQTHESLIPNLIEEAYETVDTIQRGDLQHLKEELGDLLLQVVFHSELTEEAGLYNFDDVARDVSEKLVRRHPHVFGESSAGDSDAVLKQWDAIKRAEKGDQEKPYLHGVGKGLPSLIRAAKLQKKVSKVGFDWPDQSGVLDKIREEITELEEAIQQGNEQEIASELGDLIFSAVNLCRFRKLDPEAVLAAANRKFEERFHQMEGILRHQGLTLESASGPEMEIAWDAAKKELA
jgi:MazG family protein